MPLLLSCQSICKSYGAQHLFEDISFGLSEGERSGLIGPNGSGKSTLLKILAGLEVPDTGTVSSRKKLSVGYVPQESDFPSDRSVHQILEACLAPALIEEGEKTARLRTVMGKAGFDDDHEIAGNLSGGWKKRLAIACELVRAPDLLLLDEPTNHLDLQGIEWLETLLVSAPFASLIVSHDRYFLDNVVTHMIELNRLYPPGLFNIEGSYTEFLVKKEEFLAAQSKQEESLANKVRREAEWLRRGPKARRGKSRSRIKAAEGLMSELAEVRARNSQAATLIDFTSSHRKSKQLIRVEKLGKQMGNQTLFSDLSFILSPGVKLGLLGANGSGKTTLLKLLTGEVAPDSGRVERADGLRLVVFDQSRAQLEKDLSLRRTLAPDGDSVIYRDQSVHIAGYARRFLFRPEQLDMPVGRLSGGEQARALIARLMLQPADLLLLDEPTNDLDIPTLEILEESLSEFPGALVLVTHDRFMLDRICTVVLGLDGEGGSGVFADYLQWEEACSLPKSDETAKAKVARTEGITASDRPKRLSYLDQIEWDQMERKILDAETILEQRRREAEDPAIASDGAKLLERHQALEEAQELVSRLYARWAELEKKKLVLDS